MSARFKKWIQKSCGPLTVWLFFNPLLAQPVKLLPEADLMRGLPSNSIRVIRTAPDKKIWLGTDNGLVILNDHDSASKRIVKAFYQVPVWGIGFTRNEVVIASRFNGISVYDLITGNRKAYFDTLQFNYCRKLRIIHDTVFLAGKFSSGYLVRSDKKWKFHPLSYKPINGFITDFFLWNKKIYAAYYTYDIPKSTKGYAMIKDSLILSSALPFFKVKNKYPGFFAVTADDDRLFGSGDDLFSYYDKNKNAVSGRLADKGLVAWDVCFKGPKIYVAIGQPVTMKEGMVFEYGKSAGAELRSDLFAQSLYYDEDHQGLWVGSYNKGLFFWPSAEKSHHLPDPASDYRFARPSNNTLIFHNREAVFELNIQKDEIKKIYRVKEPALEAIGYANLFHDTLLVVTNYRIEYRVGKGKLTEIDRPRFSGWDVHKEGNRLWVPSMYQDMIIRLDLKTLRQDTIPAPCNEVRSLPYKNGYFYYSETTGFSYIDSILHRFSNNFPVVESFAICHDTLWVLNAGLLRSYQIDIKQERLNILAEKNIRNLVEGFHPSWVCSINNILFTGNASGVLRINPKIIEPEWYQYVGQFNESEKPFCNDQELFFYQKNYLQRIVPANPVTKLEFRPEIEQEDGNELYENAGFDLRIKHPDHFIQNRYLKKLEIWENGQLKRTCFTLDSLIHISEGLPGGRYEFRLFVNGIHAVTVTRKVKVHLLRSPWFFFGILLVTIAFLLLVVKYRLTRKNYERRLAVNRLQLLKQNLNPHFIFNSLNLIYMLVLENKNKEAVNAINQFSDLHRYYLDNINQTEISLFEELGFIEKYLHIEQARTILDAPIEYELNIGSDISLNKITLPPLILQPLIENAVKFSVVSSTLSNPGKIWIDINRKEDRIKISIENTLGARANDKTIGTKSGLNIVRERLALYNDQSKLPILFTLDEIKVHTQTGFCCSLELITRI